MHLKIFIRKLKTLFKNPGKAIPKIKQEIPYFWAEICSTLRSSKIPVVSKPKNLSKFNEKIVKIINQRVTQEELLEKCALSPIYDRIYDQTQHRKRLLEVADFCSRNHEGDLLEIGCFRGDTTVGLAEIAKKYNRKVIGVDPWPGKWQGHGSESDFQKFLENIEGYKDQVQVIRLSSLSKEAKQIIKSRKLCFAYIDGLHTYSACLSDIKTVSHVKGVIAVDDIFHVAELLLAFEKGAYLTQRIPFHNKFCREGHLLKNNKVDEKI